MVGLRPYRASGFIVDAARFGNKLLVHNYGHGGWSRAPNPEQSNSILEVHMAMMKNLKSV